MPVIIEHIESEVSAPPAPPAQAAAAPAPAAPDERLLHEAIAREHWRFERLRAD